MHALRTRAACVARRTRPTSLRISRSYASNGHDDHTPVEHGDQNLKDHLPGEHGDHGHDSHGHDHHGHHHHAPEVPEGLGTGFYVFAAAAPLAFLGYQVTRPGANGEPSSATTWLRRFEYFNDYEERNALRSNLLDQASHDKHLFLYAGKNPHVELKMPELIDSGSPWNVPAGFYPNLSHVTDHYRKQAAEEEERKFKKLQRLAAKAEAEAEQKKEAEA